MGRQRGAKGSGTGRPQPPPRLLHTHGRLPFKLSSPPSPGVVEGAGAGTRSLTRRNPPPRPRQTPSPHPIPKSRAEAGAVVPRAGEAGSTLETARTCVLNS